MHHFGGVDVRKILTFGLPKKYQKEQNHTKGTKFGKITPISAAWLALPDYEITWESQKSVCGTKTWDLESNGCHFFN